MASNPVQIRGLPDHIPPRKLYIRSLNSCRKDHLCQMNASKSKMKEELPKMSVILSRIEVMCK
jgi:hypothetical protein